MLAFTGAKLWGSLYQRRLVSKAVSGTHRAYSEQSGKTYLTIGGAKIQVDAKNANSSRVPLGYFDKNKDSQAYLKFLKWLIQKDNLRQDMFLIGSPPGAYRRHVALSYAELTNREIEYLCLSRDTTEADIKQRREIVDGSIVYKNQCAVNAALNGRLLIIEGLSSPLPDFDFARFHSTLTKGIEKAERNLLPILNNLLENREINLDDGRFLVAPERYDKLVALAQETGVDLDKQSLLRVHENFRVLAIGLPVPKYKGNPLVRKCEIARGSFSSCNWYEIGSSAAFPFPSGTR
jgi:hypothetical protein